MSSIWVLCTLGLFWEVSGQLLPLTTKQDGSVDMSILVNHITRQEQTLTELQKKTTQLETDLQVTKSDLQTTKADLETTKTELETTKSGLQDQQMQLTSVHNSINNLALKTKTVAFSVALSTVSNISHHPVKFDIVEYNEGNGYNKTTGRFTAPVSGTYMFSAQVGLYDTSKAHHTSLLIIKAVDVMTAGHIIQSGHVMVSGHITIPITTVMYMRQGEEMWAQTDHDVQVGWVHENHFVGALLSAY